MIQCKFCKKEFSNKSNLRNHQKTANYCLKIQGNKKQNNFKCEHCDKVLSSTQRLKIHQISCKMHLVNKTVKNIIKEYDQKLLSRDEIISLQEKFLQEIRQDYKELVDKYVKSSQDRVKLLNKKYLKKQPRQKYQESNVIYVLTTNLLKKERRYILGKATNLTNRLSTYNKSDEHQVVFHKSCGDKNNMKVVEEMVFIKLHSYREKANRERFILPEDKEINIFTDTICKCIDFVKE